MECFLKNCNRLYYSNGYCRHHYDKDRRHGSPLFESSVERGIPFKKDLICNVPSCDRKGFAKDLCHKHYMKIRRSGTLDSLQVYGEASKQKSRERTAKWKKDNWGYYKSYLLSRKKRVRLATPVWADKKQIIEIYKNCPKGFHVDHIIPISGKNVSGLHVPYNLQYLSKSENLKKGTKIYESLE